MSLESIHRLGLRGRPDPALITPLYAFLAQGLHMVTEMHKEAFMKADRG